MKTSGFSSVFLTLLLCMGLVAVSGDASAAVHKKKAGTASPKAAPAPKKGHKKGKAKRPATPRKKSGSSSRVHRPHVPPTIPAGPPIDPGALAPVPLEMPQGALAPFFRDLSALEAGGGDNGTTRVVRVLHFGDSHVAADYWSGELRRLLQQRFGDAGVGYVMPGHPWKYFRHALAKTLDGDGWQTTGLAAPPPDGVLGLSGVSLSPRKDTPASVLAPGRNFKVTLAAESDKVPVLLLVDNAPADNLSVSSHWINSGGSDVALLSISNRDPLPDVPRKLSVMASPGNGTRLLGAEFTNGRSGLILDTLGLNGGRMTALEKWSPRMRRQLLLDAKPSLVIVSYGTNEIAAKKFTFEGFKADCVRVLRALKEDAGGAAILVTGPADRAGKKKSGWSLMTQDERPVVRALREAAAETGCAFWDLQAAMGGEGAVFSWMQAGLGQTDGVHFTQAGYERQGRMLYDRLMAAYELK